MVPAKQTIDGGDNNEIIHRNLSFGKIADLSQMGVDQAQQIMNGIVKQIVSSVRKFYQAFFQGNFVRSGRQVALDLKLPNDVYLMISGAGYEFRNKNGIAEFINDILSSTGKKTE